MKSPLQQFGFRDSQYERPQHPWVCGDLCEGRPCWLGPSAEGVCGGAGPCTPEKQGDRYYCTRSPAHGGACVDGPLPDGGCSQPGQRCRPARNLLGRRRQVTFAVVALSLGCCLLLFGGTDDMPPFSPGPLSGPHGSFENECARCHEAARGDSHWSAWILGDGDHGLADSRRCLECHAELGTNALLAHSVPAPRLAAETSGVPSDPATVPALLRAARYLPAVPRSPEGEIACAVCHREHHGREFDLRELGNLQCQTCHSRQFESFENGHPGLDDYLYQRRTRIAFDHARHYSEYFDGNAFLRLMPQGRRPDSCLQCHEQDEATGTFLTKSYEQSCAVCHDTDLRDAAFPGVEFLALPALSESDLAAARIDVGAWPKTGGSRLQLAPLLRWLLMSDEETRGLLARFDAAGGRFTPELLQAHPELAARLLQGVKTLLVQVTEGGPAELDRRLQAVFGNRFDLSRLAGRARGGQSFSYVLQAAVRNWFTVGPDPEAVEEPSAVAPPDSGWYFARQDQTIRYRPAGHADPVLRTWLDALVGGREVETDGTDGGPLWDVLSQPSGSGTLEFGPAATGRCLSCHSVDRARGTAAATIQWRALRPESETRPFTRFSHTPHVKLLNDRNCGDCHQLADAPDVDSAFYAEAYFQRHQQTGLWTVALNPHQALSSGFAPLQKADCAQCHTANAAGNTCLQCHNYHVSDHGGGP